MNSKEVERALCVALDAYERSLKAAQIEMTTDGRGGAITALQAAIQLTNAIPEFESQSLALPLTALLAALKDLDSGRVGRMLAAKKGVNNRKPDAGFRKVQRAAAIFSVDQLIAATMTVEDACKFVAALLHKGGIPIEGRVESPAWRTVRGWRYDATKRHADDQEAHTLAALRAECTIPRGTPIEQVKEEIIRRLTTFLKAWSPGLE